ncbi:MAG: hypothetical protein AB4080_12760 [Trichodesmium sp.]
MYASYMNQPMNKEKLEQLEALTKVMFVSFLWKSSGLLDDSKPQQTKQNTTNKSATNTQTDSPQEK